MTELIDIARKSINLMLKSETTAELVTLSAPGSSGSRVFIFKRKSSETLYAVKCVKSARVTLVEEVARRAALVPMLGAHLPDVLWCQVVDGFEVMISECKGLQTLHSMVLQSDLPQARLLSIWDGVLEQLMTVWRETAQAPFQENLCPRYLPSRLERIQSALKNCVIQGVCLGECWSTPIFINGVEYPSLESSFNEIYKIRAPLVEVMCHGDPQPSNVVIGEGGSWFLIDWEWSGHHQDWRGMVSHLIGWWSSRCLILQSDPLIRLVPGKGIELVYEAVMPNHIQKYQNLVFSKLVDKAPEPITESVLHDVDRMLAVLYFGELRFLELWGRQSFSVPMLGQAVLAACPRRIYKLNNGLKSVA